MRSKAQRDVDRLERRGRRKPRQGRDEEGTVVSVRPPLPTAGSRPLSDWPIIAPWPTVRPNTDESEYAAVGFAVGGRTSHDAPNKTLAVDLWAEPTGRSGRMEVAAMTDNNEPSTNGLTLEDFEEALRVALMRAWSSLDYKLTPFAPSVWIGFLWSCTEHSSNDEGTRHTKGPCWSAT